MHRSPPWNLQSYGPGDWGVLGFCIQVVSSCCFQQMVAWCCMLVCVMLFQTGSFCLFRIYFASYLTCDCWFHGCFQMFVGCTPVSRMMICDMRNNWPLSTEDLDVFGKPCFTLFQNDCSMSLYPSFLTHIREIWKFNVFFSQCLQCTPSWIYNIEVQLGQSSVHLLRVLGLAPQARRLGPSFSPSASPNIGVIRSVRCTAACNVKSYTQAWEKVCSVKPTVLQLARIFWKQM